MSDDLHAVGVVGYEALTGRRAFPEESLVALAHAITEAPPPLRVGRISIPGWPGVVDQAVTRDAAARFPSADAIAVGTVPRRAIADERANQPPTWAQSVRPPEPPTVIVPRPPVRTGRVLLIVAAVVALIVGGVAVGFAAAQDREPFAPAPSSSVSDNYQKDNGHNKPTP